VFTCMMYVALSDVFNCVRPGVSRTCFRVLCAAGLCSVVRWLLPSAAGQLGQAGGTNGRRTTVVAMKEAGMRVEHCCSGGRRVDCLRTAPGIV
jgi:hypothetical protein